MPYNIAIFYKNSLNLNMLKTESEGRINTEETPLSISEYDKNAIEEAVRIKEKFGGKVIAISILTWGPLKAKSIEAERIGREVLSLGADEVHLVLDEALSNSTTLETSIVASYLLKKLGGFDLYLTGEYSMDTTSAQFASRLGRILNLPVITFASKIEIKGSQIFITRSLEKENQLVSSSMPCIISVTGEINQPRIPTLKQILQAKNKPIIKYDLKSLGVNFGFKALKQIYYTLPVKRKNQFIEGNNVNEIAEKLLDALLEEGVIKI